MSVALQEQRVNCRRCRYRFPVHAQSTEGWRVEAQCPICEAWACFTAADTQDPPRPDPAELEQATQQIGERLWRPINENRGHAAVKWVDKVGNGLFEDDHTPMPWAMPTSGVYRFRRGTKAAYLWQEGGSWFVRGWYSLRGRRPPEPAEVFSFEAGLDRLAE